jgi:hypothetical protein
VSAGWQVGDLALCLVPSGTRRIGPAATGSTKPRQGQLCTVIGVLTHLGEVGLVIEGHPSAHKTTAWLSTSFRKIKPDTEPCEEEFALLIKRKVGA